MPNTASVEEVLKLQDKAEQARAKAREELEAMIADCQRQLELLSSPGAGKSTSKKKGAKPLHCPICNTGGHDRRKHRDHPEAFTREELSKLPAS